MNYLLDTCLLSEFMKKTSDVGVMEWFESQDEETLYISVLAVGEIKKGITKLDPSRRKEELADWLEKVVKRYDRRILPFTLSEANLWGKVKGGLEKRGTVLSVIDSLMAATALDQDLTIVTRNVDDFAATGVRVVNPWSA